MGRSPPPASGCPCLPGRTDSAPSTLNQYGQYGAKLLKFPAASCRVLTSPQIAVRLLRNDQGFGACWRTPDGEGSRASRCVSPPRGLVGAVQSEGWGVKVRNFREIRSVRR